MKRMLCCRILLAVTMTALLMVTQSSDLATHTQRLPRSKFSPALHSDFNPSSLQYDEFDWTFFKRVAFGTPGNMLVSPLSLKLTLGILKEASTGWTGSEIGRVLGLTSDRKDLRTKFYSIIQSLQKSDKYLLDLGSVICLGKHVVARQKFLAVAEEFYKTEIKKIDFDNIKIATDEINEWGANITHNKFKKLISEEDVSGVIMMVLNAIYFKGWWRKQFPSNQTKPSQFTYGNFQQVSLPFMNLKETFFFCKSDTLDATLIRLPYLEFAMYIVLPNTITGVDHVVTNLNFSQLRQDILQMRERTVRLSMPRFRFEYHVQLKEILKDMGIRQAFDFTASFPGISRGQALDDRLRISSIKQKAGIEVNEEGSEAYTTTGISLVDKASYGQEEVVEFKVNKPFVFFIEDEKMRQVLFIGKVMDPLTPVSNLEEAALTKKT